MKFGKKPGWGRKRPGLQYGDQVSIVAGYGRPRAAYDRLEWVIAVQGMAAITDHGTLIPCRNKSSVFIPTGKHRKRVRITKDVQWLLRAGGWKFKK